MLPHLFAYLDLASGSMIIQAAIAGVVAVPILLRNQIRRLFGRGRPATDDILDEPTEAAMGADQARAHTDGPDAGRA